MNKFTVFAAVVLVATFPKESIDLRVLFIIIV